MVSQNPNQRNSLYPQVIDSNPETCSSDPSSSLYPKTDDVGNLIENLFPDNTNPSTPPVVVEEVLIKVPGTILHLIDKACSVELACGNLMEESSDSDSSSSDEEGGKAKRQNKKKKKKDSNSNFGASVLSHGLTIASKGQEDLLKELDKVLQECSAFSVQKVSEKAKKEGDVVDASVALAISPVDLEKEEKKEMMEEKCAAYWTTLAPNMEDYSGTATKLIAASSGQLVKGILWCGDVTVEQLRWGNEVMKRRMTLGSQGEISPKTLKRIKRVKKVTKMTESVANGVLTGVVKVSGFFTSSVANSKAGKKFFSLLPGEVVLASLDGFSKVCDAVEVAGKSVMSTSNTVTTELVNHRYGEEAAKATSEGLDAAGHAAWYPHVGRGEYSSSPRPRISPPHLVGVFFALLFPASHRNLR
ncbi:hypothetical protein JHK86_045306 [Glycine max]|nr:hypothetical protein JHK86_045306 [Glycine max]